MPAKKQEPIIGVQLDLKGLVHRPDYWPTCIADLAGRGINTVLVEYEDVFPFEGVDVAADPSVTWSMRTLKRFQAAAKKHNVRIIPLQQCLGHLEYVFRWDRYRRFALDRKYPSTLKLSSTKGRALVRDMLEQVIAAHPGSDMIHLGMDEGRLGNDGDVFAIFLDHLRDLLDVVEAYGRTAVVWSDMLEDHFRALPLDEFRERVIFMPWDYGTRGKRTAAARIGGFRVSRAWLNEPANPDAPPIAPGQKFVEDLPADAKKLIEPHRNGKWFRPLPQVDLWTQQGMRVIGGTAIRSSSHGPMLPRYHEQRENIRTWADAIARTKQMGLIATSWARGTTFCPPNFPIEAAWPLVDELVDAMQPKRRRKPFWPGVPGKTARRIIDSLGRCRVDWSIEGDLAAEMKALRPKVKEHRYEWDSIALLARVVELRRCAEYALAEVDYFHANTRPVDSEWQRRLNDQASVLRDIKAMRQAVKAHFAKRYHGDAFAEWLRDLFDHHETRLRAARDVSKKKKADARAAGSRLP